MRIGGILVFEYNCEIIDVYDGDTLHCEVDLGCDIKLKMTVRLTGIDAPEMGTAEGVSSKEWLQSLLGFDYYTGIYGPCVIKTEKDHKEKYGRYLGTFFLQGEDVSVNEMMVADGYAVPYDGGKR
jgi:micrococcal nuclease